MKTDKSSLHRILSLIAFPLVIAATIVVVVVFRHQLWLLFSSPEKIKQAIDRWGIGAPIAFMLLQFTQVVIFVIPGEIPQIAGGYLFGMAKGVIYSIIGIALGSTFDFYVARLLGVPFVRHLFKDELLRKFDKITHSPRAQIAFFLLFVIPGIPKDALCYVGGLSPLRFPAFLLISTLGRLPGIIGSAGMGNAAASEKWILTISILAGSTVLFVIGLIYREKVHTIIERFALRKSSRMSPPEEKPESDDV